MDDTTRLERTTLTVAAEQCQLVLEDGHITIVKERAAQDATTVAFPVREVRGATLERPSRSQPGWLHVGAVGGTPAPTGDLGAALDPYTIPVTSRNVAVARRLVRLVTDHVQQRGLPPEHTPLDGRVSASVTVTRGPAAVSGPLPSTPPPPIPPPRSPSPPSPSPPASTSAETSAPTVDAPSGLDEPEVVAEDPSDEEVEDRLVATLRDLADLHRSGALTDDEFQLAKAKVLGNGGGGH
jgi:hypothetical protein